MIPSESLFGLDPTLMIMGFVALFLAIYICEFIAAWFFPDDAETEEDDYE